MIISLNHAHQAPEIRCDIIGKKSPARTAFGKKDENSLVDKRLAGGVLASNYSTSRENGRPPLDHRI